MVRAWAGWHLPLAGFCGFSASSSTATATGSICSAVGVGSKLLSSLCSVFALVMLSIVVCVLVPLVPASCLASSGMSWRSSGLISQATEWVHTASSTLKGKCRSRTGKVSLLIHLQRTTYECAVHSSPPPTFSRSLVLSMCVTNFKYSRVV